MPAGGAVAKYGGRGVLVLILARTFAALHLISKKDYEHFRFHIWSTRRLATRWRLVDGRGRTCEKE